MKKSSQSNRKMKIIPALISFCIILLLFTGYGAAVSDEGNIDHSKTLVLVYMVGSDLESGGENLEGGDGTNDILNMVKGYGSTNPEDLNIIIGYGGSDKPGWEGMTIVPISSLIRDAEDEVIGNEEIGDLIDSSIDMGSPDGLSTFLSHISDHYSGDKTHLILWNHGGGFEGFGWDGITDNHLSISDIESVLNNSGMEFDIIGFDACLMAGLEVAKAMAPHAKYMLASEEISSGGWKYDEWVSSLAQNPEMSSAEFGKIVIDSFFNADEPSGNTASMIDLQKLEPVQDSLNELGLLMSNDLSDNSSIISVARAFEKSTRFGENVDDEHQQALKIDIGTLADYLLEVNPESEEIITVLKSALSDAIVYEYHDQLAGNATGLSIADPLTLTDDDFEAYSDVLTISPGWDEYTRQVQEEVKTELLPPDLVSVGTNTYTIKDSTGYEEASVVYFAYDNETESFIQLGTLPLENDEQGTLDLPDWNGEWYYLSDLNNPDNYALIDLYYGDTTGAGISKYLSEVDIIRNGTQSDSVLYTYVDPETEWTKYSFRPYIIEEGDTIFSRSGFTPMAGDGFISYGTGYDKEGNEIGLMTLGEMNLTGSPEIVNDTLPDGIYGWALSVTNPNGEETIGDIRLLKIENGEVTVLDN